MKPTFKIRERTGRYRSFGSEWCDIKLNGQNVGWISRPIGGAAKVFLHVKDDSHAGFRNAQLKANYASIKEAKDAIKANWPQIAAKFNIHQLQP